MCCNEQLTDAAHRLVWLRGMRVRVSSQNTYASSLHRYVRFGTSVCNKTPQELLPLAARKGADGPTVELFVSWASTRYKFNTIQSTITTLIDWHKDKGVPNNVLTDQPMKHLLATVKAEQGPDGLPAGKTRMAKPVLRLMLKYIQNRRNEDPTMSELYLRDECWALLGFFGMLRRSELVALNMQDVTIGHTQGHTYVELIIRRSKTDRGGAGATVTIAGTSRDGIEIAKPLLEWLSIRRRAGANEHSPLFPAWNLDTLKCHREQRLTNGAALAVRLKKYLREIIAKYPQHDLSINPESYGMHSLRRGGVMAAWAANVDIEKIKAHGRWKSDAVRAYMGTTRPMRLMVTQRM